MLSPVQPTEPNWRRLRPGMQFLLRTLHFNECGKQLDFGKFAVRKCHRIFGRWNQTGSDIGKLTLCFSRFRIDMDANQHDGDKLELDCLFR